MPAEIMAAQIQPISCRINFDTVYPLIPSTVVFDQRHSRQWLLSCGSGCTGRDSLLKPEETHRVGYRGSHTTTPGTPDNPLVLGSMLAQHVPCSPISFLFSGSLAGIALQVFHLGVGQNLFGNLVQCFFDTHWQQFTPDLATHVVKWTRLGGVCVRYT